MSQLPFGFVDVLEEEPGVHTVDAGELMEDMD
jgi:hypothetical protein